MKRQLLTGLGIIELGALVMIFRSAAAAPVVESERDVRLRSDHSNRFVNNALTAQAV